MLATTKSVSYRLLMKNSMGLHCEGKKLKYYLSLKLVNLC